MDTTTAHPEDTNQTRPPALSRPVQGRMIAGVAAALARYLHVDVTVVRIALAVLTVVGFAGVPFCFAGLALYLAGWLLIPEEGADQSIAGRFIQSRQAGSH